MREKVDAARTGEFLSALRKARSLTQEQVAEALCVSNKTISKWESGSGLPDITILPDLAEFYGITVDDLLAGQRLANEQKTAEIRQKHLERLFREADFRVSVVGLCMAALPLTGFLLKNNFRGLGLTAIEVLTLLITALAVWGLFYGCRCLEELSAPDIGQVPFVASLKLRQRRYLLLLLMNACLCGWQLLQARTGRLQDQLYREYGKFHAGLPLWISNCLLLLCFLILVLRLLRRNPALLGRKGRRLLGIEYGLCWISQLAVFVLALRGAFFVQQVKWSINAAWKWVYFAERFFVPLLTLLVLTFAAYTFLKREER